MSNIKYDQLVSHVEPEVSGCSVPLIEQALRDSAIEFCANSMIWIVINDSISVTAGEPTYEIEVPIGASLVQIKSIKLSGELLSPLSVDQLDINFPHWKTKQGQPKHYSQVDDDEFFLVPVPEATINNALDVVLAVQPSRNSTYFPNWINNRYQDGIVAGAKARLMRKQNTAWHNPQQAMAYQYEFDQSVVSAKASSDVSLGRAFLRTTSRH